MWLLSLYNLLRIQDERRGRERHIVIPYPNKQVKTCFLISDGLSFFWLNLWILKWEGQSCVLYKALRRNFRVYSTFHLLSCCSLSSLSAPTESTHNSVVIFIELQAHVISMAAEVQCGCSCVRFLSTPKSSWSSKCSWGKYFLCENSLHRVLLLELCLDSRQMCTFVSCRQTSSLIPP